MDSQTRASLCWMWAVEPESSGTSWPNWACPSSTESTSRRRCWPKPRPRGATGQTELAVGAYAGIVSSGAFTHGIFGPETILKLLRAASPGARFALGINSAHFEEVGFADWLGQRQSDGHISEPHFELRPINGDADEADPNQWSRIAVFSAS